MKNFLKRLANLVKSSRKEIPLNDSQFVKNICKFVVNECVVGDYYEFGVYRGQTLVSFYEKLTEVATKRIKNTGGEGREAISRGLRGRIKNETLFHAFDSFEGLPELSNEDQESSDFAEGQYSAAVRIIQDLAADTGMPDQRLKLHKGWFSDTCTPEYFAAHSLKPAAIIWLDCDLYSSAKDALKMIGMIIQDGTIIVVDDWYCFKGNPERGVQRAWFEFAGDSVISSQYRFSEYQNDGWARKSFIVNKKGTSS